MLFIRFANGQDYKGMIINGDAENSFLKARDWIIYLIQNFGYTNNIQQDHKYINDLKSYKTIDEFYKNFEPDNLCWISEVNPGEVIDL